MGDEAKIKSGFEEASRRWPAVLWAWEAYREHVKKSGGSYLEDLYVAGAAGYRVRAAWEAIESDFGPTAKRVLGRVAHSDMTVDDMWADVVVRLMDSRADDDERGNGKGVSRLVSYRGLIPLVNYLITIGRRIAIQRHRKRKERSYQVDETTEESGQQSFDPESRERGPGEVLIDRETDRSIRDAIAGAFERMSSEHRFLVAVVYGQGMKQKEAGRLLGWSEFRTSREMNKAIEGLKESLQGLSGVDWTPALTDSWKQVWEKSWNQAQVLRMSASDLGKVPGRNSDGRK